MALGKSKKDRLFKILLVDDEEGFVQVLAKRLRKRNFEVVTAGSGSEAIKILRKQDVDLAVVDFKMEGLDGIEVLKIFKMMDPELPVVILTGHGCVTAAVDGQRYGASDYLTKPYNFEDLVQKIHTILKKGQDNGRTDV